MNILSLAAQFLGQKLSRLWLMSSLRTVLIRPHLSGIGHGRELIAVWLVDGPSLPAKIVLGKTSQNACVVGSEQVLIDVFTHLFSGHHALHILQIVSIDSPILELLMAMIQNQVPPHIRNVFAERLTVLTHRFTPVTTSKGTYILLHHESMLPDHGCPLQRRRFDMLSTIYQVLMVHPNVPHYFLVCGHRRVANLTAHVNLCKNKFVNSISWCFCLFTEYNKSLPKTYHVFESRMHFGYECLKLVRHLFILVTCLDI